MIETADSLEGRDPWRRLGTSEQLFERERKVEELSS